MLDHLEDIESDMSVFHRVDNILDLPGPVFFARAYRLVAYKGVLRARFEGEEARKANRRHGGGGGTKLSQVVRRDPETGAMRVVKAGDRHG